MSAVYVLVALIAYLIGSISFAIIFSQHFAGFDVREKGSKNAGSTNVLRTVGKKAAALTLICDILKGVVAVVLAILAHKIWEDTDLEVLKYLAGLFVIIGHTFPVFYGFRGGKPMNKNEVTRLSKTANTTPIFHSEASMMPPTAKNRMDCTSVTGSNASV